MRTIICCKEENQTKDTPKVVFVHGYCGSGALYYKMFEFLAKHVCLILVDLPGMGASDHPQDFDKENFTPDQCNEYFVEYLEKWRKAMTNASRQIDKMLGQDQGQSFQDFYLTGHSFGAYVTGCYALKYHQRIKKLIFVSPIGLHDGNTLAGQDKDINEKEQKFMAALAAGPFGQSNAALRDVSLAMEDLQPAEYMIANQMKIFFDRQIMKFVWKRKYSPQDYTQFLGQRWTNTMIEEYLKEYQGRADFSEEQFKALRSYYNQLFKREGTSEYGLMTLFTDEMVPLVPLFTLDKLAQPDFPIPISIIVGERDWVRKQISEVGSNCVNLSKRNHGPQARYWVCPGSGHNLQLDNPQALSNIIINEVMGTNYCIEKDLPVLTYEEYIDYIPRRGSDGEPRELGPVITESVEEELWRLYGSEQLLKTRYPGWMQAHEPQILNISVEEFYDTFWADGAPFGIQQFSEQNNYNTVKTGTWCDDEFGQPTLQHQFRSPVKGIPWCDETGCWKEIKLIERSERILLLDIKATTDKLPFSDAYYFKTAWIVLGPEHSKEKKCIFGSIGTIVYLRSTVGKVILETAGRGEIKLQGTQFLDLARKGGHFESKRPNLENEENQIPSSYEQK